MTLLRTRKQIDTTIKLGPYNIQQEELGKVTSGAGDMAQLEKCLLCIYEVLSLNLQHPCKRLDTYIHVYNPDTGSQRQVDP